jgi:hypothetical protein
LLAFFILFRYLLEEIIFPATLGFGNYYPPFTFRYYALDNVYFGSVNIFIGFVFFLFDESFSSQKQKDALMQQNREAELNFLQAQMNPHFLHMGEATFFQIPLLFKGPYKQSNCNKIEYVIKMLKLPFDQS